jgi:hypothetical protein
VQAETYTTTIMEINEIQEGERLMVNEPIGKSILKKVGNDEKGYCIIIGKNRITDFMKSEEELVEYMKTEPEDFIIRLIATMIGINEDRQLEESNKRWKENGEEY